MPDSNQVSIVLLLIIPKIIANIVKTIVVIIACKDPTMTVRLVKAATLLSPSLA